MLEPLTEKEKKLVALALVGVGVRAPAGERHAIHAEMREICRKLDAEAELEEYLQDWIGHPK